MKKCQFLGGVFELEEVVLVFGFQGFLQKNTETRSY
jgi:hypothetical protein